MKVREGSITVFFALLLTTVVSIVCTALESARSSLLSYYMAQAQEAALESVFAGYYKPLWDEYHLLFMADSAGLAETMKESLAVYGNPGQGAAGNGTSLLEFEVKELQVTEAVTAVDDGGRPFLEAICEDMKAHGIQDTVELFLGQAETASDAEELSGFMSRLSAYGDTVSKLEEHYIEMEELGRNLRNRLEGLTPEALQSGGREEIETAVEEVRQYAGTVQEKAGEAYENILGKAGELSGSLTQEQRKLEEERKKVSDSSYGLMEGELRNLEAYLEGGTRQEAAEELEQLLSETAGRLAETIAWEQDHISEAFAEAIEQSRNRLEVLPEKQDSGIKEESGLLTAAETWTETGVLALVLPESAELSGKKLPAEDDPSDLGDHAERSLMEKGMAAFYGTEHFGCFGQIRENSILDYEMEYLLAGKESDRENLDHTAKRLVGIRTGMNLLYLMTDAGKRAEAEAAAAALAGFTGIYPLIRLTAGILLGAWALAEAVYDVKQLFAGGEIPLIKTAQDWKLSLAQVPAILTGGQIEAARQMGLPGEAESSLKLWNYQGYLRLLFLLGDGGRQIFRMMDMIEADLRQKDTGFFMENCISFAGTEATFTAPPRFLHLPFAGKKVWKKYASYGY